MDGVVVELCGGDESGPLPASFSTLVAPPMKLSIPSAGRAPRSRSIVMVVGSPTAGGV
jgi:hypothetical protein